MGDVSRRRFQQAPHLAKESLTVLRRERSREELIHRLRHEFVADGIEGLRGKQLARPEGLEPPTYGSGGRRSIH